MTSSRRAAASRGHLSGHATARCQAAATSRCEMAPRPNAALRAHPQRHAETPPRRETAAAIGPPLSQSASQACSRGHARLLSNSQRRRVCSAADRDGGGASASRPPAFLRGEAMLRLPVGARGCQSERRAQGSVVMRKRGGRAFVVPGGGGQPRRPAAQVSLGCSGPRSASFSSSCPAEVGAKPAKEAPGGGASPAVPWITAVIVPASSQPRAAALRG